MKVLKFGGASVENASGVRNLLEILKTTKNDKEVLIVVSAMGKTTRKLWRLADNYLNWDEESYGAYSPDLNDEFDDWDGELSWNSRELIEQYHHKIISELFDENHIVFKEVENYFKEIKKFLKHNKDKYGRHGNFVYDYLMSFGELISSKIIYHYLKDNGMDIEWLDARQLIKTDGNHRNAEVDIEKTKKKITTAIDKTKNYITQGFIGSNEKDVTTTLGFEGSDYSAALFAGILNSESITIWKDVPGILNADPRYFRNYLSGGEKITYEQEEETNKLKALQNYGPVFLMKPSLLNIISYYDVTKMAYFGASVVHPRTACVLEKMNIPLYIKSFFNPEKAGTEITNKADYDQDGNYLWRSKSKNPLFMIKSNVKIFRVSKENTYYIRNTDTTNITAAFSINNIKILMIQNLIDEFLICIENNADFNNLNNILEKQHGFSVYDDDRSFSGEYYSILLTILYPNPKVIEHILKHIDQTNIVMQQSSEDIFQMVIRYPDHRRDYEEDFVDFL